MDYDSWVSQYPALANTKFGATAQTGGLPLNTGWGEGIPSATASIADLNSLAGGSNTPGTAAAGAVADPNQFQFGANIPTFRLGMGALQTGFGLWNGIQQNKLARDSLKFTKSVTNTNLNNQIQTFNTSLADRARSRAAVEGQSDSDRDAYIEANRLRRS